MSVGDVGKMAAAEFDMWMVRAATHPFAARRQEVHLAQIAMLLHNSNCKPGKARELKDFLLFEPKVSELPVDNQVMAVMGKMVTKAK